MQTDKIREKTSCVSTEEILQMYDLNLKKGQEQKLRAHIRQCKRCSQLYEKVLKLDLTLKAKHFMKSPALDKSCPDEFAIAGFVDDALSAKEKSKIEAHLRHCDSCLYEVVSLQNTLTELKTSDPQVVPNEILLQCRNLIPEKISGISRWENLLRAFTTQANIFFGQNYGLRWAGYALIGLFVFLIGYFPLNRFFFKSYTDATHEVRGRMGTFQDEVKLLVPKAQSVVRASAVTFVWQKIAQATEYHLVLSNDIGDIIWEATVTNNRLRLSENVRLEIYKNYYWKVEAKMPNNILISSPISYFTVQEK